MSLALGLAVFHVSLARGANGRGFAGFYALTDATQAGQNYTITFTARVFNYSGANESTVAITVAGAQIQPGDIATVAGNGSGGFTLSPLERHP
jgi:hypothetical protein